MKPDESRQFAELRALLNDPNSPADEIIELLQRWPDSASKHVAHHYARDHLKRRRRDEFDPYFTSYEETKMLFDPKTNTLYTNKGDEIKKLSCPLTKKWEELEPLDLKDLKRRCHSCQRNVLNTKGLTDEQVLAIVQYDPEVCLHVDESYGNMTPLLDYTIPPDATDRRMGYRRVDPSLRVIRTARTANAINQAAAQGLWPLVRRVKSSDGHIGSYMQIWQNKETGEVSVQTDFRYIPIDGGFDNWQVIVPEFEFDPSAHFPEPLAAYLIPRDIEAGERVIIEDVIENKIAGYHHGSYRLQTAEAIWTGSDLELQYSEERDAYHAIG